MVRAIGFLRVQPGGQGSQGFILSGFWPVENLGFGDRIGGQLARKLVILEFKVAQLPFSLSSVLT